MSEENAVVSNEERELGTKSITSLFVSYSMWTLVGQLAQAVMIILEGIIVGRGLGERGLACVALIMPLEYLQIAISCSFAIGVTSLAAIKLGDGDEVGARKVYGQGLWLSIIVMTIIAAVIFIFAGPVANLLGSTPDVHNDIVTFIRIYMVGYPFCSLGYLVVYMFRVDERPSLTTWVMTIAAIVALAWLYISVFVIKIGFKGYGGYYALSIGLWSVGFLYFLFNKKTIFKVHFSDVKIDWGIAKDIIRIGIPFAIFQVSTTIFIIVVNNVLATYGSELELAAFSILEGYVLYILLIIQQSGTDGMQPIASYNYGAGNMDRVQKLLKVSIIIEIIAVGVSSLLFIVFAEPICYLFIGDDPELIAASVECLRITISCLCLGVIANHMSGYFEALERTIPAIVTGLARSALFGIPAVTLIAKVMGVKGVWFAHPVLDVLSFVLAMVFVVFEIKRLKALATKK